MQNMNIEDIRTYALNKLGSSEGLKWGENLCFMVNEKIFLVLGLDEHPTTSAFKVSEEDFNTLIERDDIKQAPYFAKNQWVKITDLENLSPKEWENYIDNAYLLVAKKLTQKAQKELGLL